MHIHSDDHRIWGELFGGNPAGVKHHRIRENAQEAAQQGSAGILAGYFSFRADLSAGPMHGDIHARTPFSGSDPVSNRECGSSAGSDTGEDSGEDSREDSGSGSSSSGSSVDAWMRML